MALPGGGPLHGPEYLSTALVPGTGHSSGIRPASPIISHAAKGGQRRCNRQCQIPTNRNSKGGFYIANLGPDNIGFFLKGEILSFNPLRERESRYSPASRFSSAPSSNTIANPITSWQFQLQRPLAVRLLLGQKKSRPRQSIKRTDFAVHVVMTGSRSRRMHPSTHYSQKKRETLHPQVTSPQADPDAMK